MLFVYLLWLFKWLITETKPAYLFLVGKSIQNSLCRYDTINWKNNLVPTYGETPSDWQFGRYGNNDIPEIAVGRISANQPEDVLNYLNKVKQCETKDVDYCDAETLSWRKEVLQFGCWSRTRQITDILYGANWNCMSYSDFRYARQEDTLRQQDSLRSLLNRKGFGLITYNGYSTTSKSWYYDIGEAKDYTDQNRYPFIFSLTQFTGNIHQPSSDQIKKPSMSEAWVLEKDAGAIAYLGATHYGFPPALSEYGEEMYRQLAYKNYNQPIGKSILNIIQNIYRDNEGVLITQEAMNLQGDPAIIINYMPKPEFEIKASNITFKPDTIITPLDSIDITLQLINAGIYNLSDTVQLCIERKDAAGNTLNTHQQNLIIANKTETQANLMLTVEAHAKVAITLFDAFISCWDEKYRSQLIRPETVINEHIDAEWMPILQTPPFPEYTSGHSVISAAAALTLSKIFGDQFAFTDDVEVKYGLLKRSFQSFKQASQEAAISRLYGGIHYMPAITYGVQQGEKVGQFVNEHIDLGD